MNAPDIRNLPPPESYYAQDLPPPDAETLVKLVADEYDYTYEEALAILVQAKFETLVKVPHDQVLKA